MVTDFTELPTEKTPRGMRQRLCENQVIQMQRAQAEARLGSARAYLLSGLTEIWEAVGETGKLSLEQNATIRLASTRAIDQAREVVNILYHSAGATAIFDDRPFERRSGHAHSFPAGPGAASALRDDRPRSLQLGAGHADVRFLKAARWDTEDSSKTKFHPNIRCCAHPSILLARTPAYRAWSQITCIAWCDWMR
jgi:hypothetical protein